MNGAESYPQMVLVEELTGAWKATLAKYQDAVRSGKVPDIARARDAEAERRELFSELNRAFEQLRAEYPDDAPIGAALEALRRPHGFLRYEDATTITPYLDRVINSSSLKPQGRDVCGIAVEAEVLDSKIVRAPVSEIVLKAGEAIDLSPRAIHNNWLQDGWPERLLKARISQHGMTQKEAAHACGVAGPTYKRWERGSQPPAIRNIPQVRTFIESAERRAGSRPQQALQVAEH